MATGTILDLQGLQALIDALRGRGYRVIGPTLRDGALVLADITSVEDLPRGIGDDQAAGHYRTRARDDEALFGFAATAQSAKPVLFPPDEQLWRGTRVGEGFEVSPREPRAGARRPARDPRLRPRRDRHPRHRPARPGGDRRALRDAARRTRSSIAVTCATPAGTCFCASMGTGPKPGEGADLTLTELLDPHRFLVETGTPRGRGGPG